MDRPDVEGMLAADPMNLHISTLCKYILSLESREGWTHAGAMEWFKDCCSLIGFDPPPYSWFARCCRDYGYELPIGVFRRFANSGKTVFDLDTNKSRSPLPYFATICENIRFEQKEAAKEGLPAPPPYRKEYEANS